MGERTNNETWNLLHGFTGSGDPTGSDPEEEVELNLGLSLGGRFGVDKSNLVRSSSIAAILPVVKNDDVLTGSKGIMGRTGSYSGLVRTTSLPVVTEEEWQKRKEIQSLRRLAAKRRRSEKQRSLTRVDREKSVAGMGRVGPPFGSSNWDFDGSELVTGASSEFESRHVQGSGASPSSLQSNQERTNHDGTNASLAKPVDPMVRPLRSKTESQANNKGKEIRSNAVDMPCVFTQGDGPSGRRIEGILYKYGKGEEVKIMCVCHGSFLTPAEFVRHAGGTDMVHPLKHIVVNPNSSYL